MMLDPGRAWRFFVEEELGASMATIFLTNRTCPWQCVMCDLWKNTLPETVPVGAIPEQIEAALAQMPAARQIKLYNSGSFFDPRAIPVADYAAIAQLVRGFERVIVECHPALVGERCLEFGSMIPGQLEIAMGLETAHADVLAKLNKRMTLEQFAAAASFLRANGIDLRAFILVQPPFEVAEEALYWAERSLDFAFDCGARVATLIPTRGFVPPSEETMRAAWQYGQALGRGAVLRDAWGS